MVILGIDPGYATLGYGIISSDGRRHKALAYGVLETPKTDRFPQRLCSLAKGIEELIEKYQPDAVAVEELFFHTNQKTGILVAEARGVVLYIAENSNAKLFEYTPLQIKQAITGYGRAAKAQIQEMVRVFLALPAIPKPDDAADALAVALTHAQTNTYLGNYGI
ncbi:MAG: crossover junction endodeoxyribonuclease RuvC [Clostridia bacterium]